MRISINSRQFQKDMKNIIDYSFGFLDGSKRGQSTLYAVLAPQIAEYASMFVDSNARVSPDLLHHIYEWHNVGSPDARLFDIEYAISGMGITFTSSFRQSQSIKKGSNVPFYNKAEIMEKGLGVTIQPKRANVLAFEVNGEEVFTPNPVRVSNPGGNTKGQFKNVVDNFFRVYFRQTFLKASGLQDKLKYPKVYSRNLSQGKRSGRSLGIKTGFQWIATAGVPR